MKLANLPGGKRIAFADEMDDQGIDDVVRAVTTGTDNQSKLAVLNELVSTLTQAFTIMTQNNVQLTQAIIGIANSMGALDKSLTIGNKSIEQMALLLSNKLDTIAAVYSAPRELTTNKEGKPTGFQVKLN